LIDEKLHITERIFPLPAYFTCSPSADAMIPKLMPTASIRLKAAFEGGLKGKLNSIMRAGAAVFTDHTK